VKLRLQGSLVLSCFVLIGCALSAAQPSPVQASSSGTKIVTLGTGTPRPNPERSGSATAIVVGDRAYLVDFGPGVVRRAAAAAAKGIGAVDPAKISVAFVTHLHSDHTAGYPDLILSPWLFGRKQLDVYGPEGIEDMTRHVLEAYRRDIEVRTTGLEHRDPLVVHAHDVKPGIIYKDDRVSVKAFIVAHGQWGEQAFGYRFETPDRVVVISGDTSPSEAVVANCHPCDVLIHEALAMAQTAPMKDWATYRAHYHTTSEQLAGIANRAKPGLLIVDHIGNATDAELLQEIQKTYHGKVAISHDLDVF